MHGGVSEFPQCFWIFPGTCTALSSSPSICPEMQDLCLSFGSLMLGRVNRFGDTHSWA